MEVDISSNKSRVITAGERYGRLTVESLHHKDERWRRYYTCLCDCGNTAVVHAGALRSGNTRSCGCLAKDVAASRRLPDNHGEVTAIILGYKRHAKSRGYTWRLTREDVVRLIAMDCHYCGTPPSSLKRTKNSIDGLMYNGIDRVDSSVGYILKNCVPCCKMCNMGKRDHSRDKFLAWVKRVAQHQEAMADQWG